MAHKGHLLLPGQSLFAGDYLLAPNGRYSAYLQYDGNFTVCWGTPPDALVGAMWDAGTGGAVVAITDAKELRLTMQDDANLVLYRLNEALWSSGTARQRGDYFAMIQDDGNFVSYNGTPASRREPFWDSHTYETRVWLHNSATRPAVRSQSIRPAEGLSPGEQHR